MASIQPELDLPAWNSPEFGSLCGIVLVMPYLFICGIYFYHFTEREKQTKIRIDAAPKKEHIFDWKEALFRPEGISAVIMYMFFGLCVSIMLNPFGIDFVPRSIKTLTLEWHPVITMLHFVIFDTLMYCIHYVQHHWRWLYVNTHSVHHTITSPTIIVALTGYLPDTFLLIIVPLHLTLFIVDFITVHANFVSVFVFGVLALAHLHCIHSEFENRWDSFFYRIGIVCSWDHHVHHLTPRKNLAHFFVAIDKIFGTYNDPKTIKKIRTDS